MSTLDELERAVYVSPTVENLMAYIKALETAYSEACADRDGNAEDLKLAESEVERLTAELDQAADKITEYENALGID